MVVIYQMNLQLGLVNDLIDHRLILEHNFVPKLEVFQLEDAFKFIVDMFAQDLFFQRATLKF
mgnify:FL=1